MKLQASSGPSETIVSYQFLCGDPSSIAIFVPESKTARVIAKKMSNRLNLRDFLLCLEKDFIAIYQIHQFLHGTFFSKKFEEYIDPLKMIERANIIFSTLPGFLVNLEVTSRRLHPAWWKRFKRSTLLEVKFSCIIYFDSGYIDITPFELREAIAVSTGNSIFVADSLLKDPAAWIANWGVQRIIGDIGKPGISILIQPATSKIRKIKPSSWRISHEPFNGEIYDSFESTSLHLSLTGYELPVNIGNHGTRDQVCRFIEASISVFDKSEWVADISTLASRAVWENRLHLFQCYQHTHAEHDETSSIGTAYSVDSWVGFLDSPLSNCVVQTQGNPMARLAAACLAVQMGHNVEVFTSNSCWTCVSTKVRNHLRFKNRIYLWKRIAQVRLRKTIFRDHLHFTSISKAMMVSSLSTQSRPPWDRIKQSQVRPNRSSMAHAVILKR